MKNPLIVCRNIWKWYKRGKAIYSGICFQCKEVFWTHVRSVSHCSPSCGKGDKVSIQKGYFYLSINKKPKLAHRYIVEKFIKRNLNRKKHIHHINHDGLDNSLSNLVVVSQKENNRLNGVAVRLMLKLIPKEMLEQITAHKLFEGEK